LYKLNLQNPQNEIFNVEQDTKKLDLTLFWHRRLRHMNFRDLHNLSQ
jgi:hypothetical protein